MTARVSLFHTVYVPHSALNGQFVARKHRNSITMVMFLDKLLHRMFPHNNCEFLPRSEVMLGTDGSTPRDDRLPSMPITSRTESDNH